MTKPEMRPIHELGQYDDGRFAHEHNGYRLDEISDMVGIAEKLPPLLRSQDPEDRRDAQRLIYLLRYGLSCPDGVWVCQSVYADAPGRPRFSNRTITWSAHLNREQAEEWHAYWTRKWAKRRDDYVMLPVSQAAGIPLRNLIHPDAAVRTDN